MLTTERLFGFELRTKDDDFGRIVDILVDEATWEVRYLVADTRRWLPGKKVVLRPDAVEGVDRDSKHVELNVTREQVKESPLLSENEPVSREMERKFHAYFGWTAYWRRAGFVDPPKPPSASIEPRDPKAASDDRPVDTSPAGGSPDPESALRSLREIRRYALESMETASEGASAKIGEIEDFLIDERVWTTPYLVVRGSDAEFGGSDRVLPTDRIRSIDWAAKRLTTAIDRATVLRSPAFDLTKTIDREFERALAETLGGSEPAMDPGAASAHRD